MCNTRRVTSNHSIALHLESSMTVSDLMNVMYQDSTFPGEYLGQCVNCDEPMYGEYCQCINEDKEDHE